MSHTTTIVPKPASGNGDIDGFLITCTCGWETTCSLKGMAEQWAAEHVRVMTCRDAQDEDEGDDFDPVDAGPWRSRTSVEDEDRDRPIPRRDLDREMSYEDWHELHVPCERPGDSWMGNEDI